MHYAISLLLLVGCATSKAPHVHAAHASAPVKAPTPTAMVKSIEQLPLLPRTAIPGIEEGLNPETQAALANGNVVIGGTCLGSKKQSSAPTARPWQQCGSLPNPAIAAFDRSGKMQWNWFVGHSNDGGKVADIAASGDQRVAFIVNYSKGFVVGGKPLPLVNGYGRAVGMLDATNGKLQWITAGEVWQVEVDGAGKVYTLALPPKDQEQAVVQVRSSATGAIEQTVPVGHCGFANMEALQLPRCLNVTLLKHAHGVSVLLPAHDATGVTGFDVVQIGADGQAMRRTVAISERQPKDATMRAVTLPSGDIMATLYVDSRYETSGERKPHQALYYVPAVATTIAPILTRSANAFLGIWAADATGCWVTLKTETQAERFFGFDLPPWSLFVAHIAATGDVTQVLAPAGGDDALRAQDRDWYLTLSVLAAPVK